MSHAFDAVSDLEAHLVYLEGARPVCLYAYLELRSRHIVCRDAHAKECVLR